MRTQTPTQCNNVTGRAQSVQNSNTALTIVVNNNKSKNKTNLLKLMALFKPNTELKDEVILSA